MEDCGDTIEKIRIGHDNSGLTAGWHLDKVTVRRLHDTGKVSFYLSFESNSCLTSGLVHPYYLDESISSFMGFGWMFSFSLYFS